MRTAAVLFCYLLIVAAPMLAQDKEKKPYQPQHDAKVKAVIEKVDKRCRQETVYMIGPQKARRLAELVHRKKPKLIVECGTALGYSGLWMAAELKALKAGKLITIEINADRAKQARQHFEQAGLSEYVTVKTGDARKVVSTIEGPVDFVFIDCNYSNYFPCYQGIKNNLADEAMLVADNVGIGAAGMKDYLDAVRKDHQSKTEWFDLDLPWAKRDAMEITVLQKKTNP